MEQKIGKKQTNRVSASENLIRSPPVCCTLLYSQHSSLHFLLARFHLYRTLLHYPYLTAAHCPHIDALFVSFHPLIKRKGQCGLRKRLPLLQTEQQSQRRKRDDWFCWSCCVVGCDCLNKRLPGRERQIWTSRRKGVRQAGSL